MGALMTSDQREVEPPTSSLASGARVTHPSELLTHNKILLELD